jgi:acetate kinase
VSDTILVVNAGSSSIKFQLFAVASGDRLERRLKGQIEGVAVKPHLIARGVGGDTLIDETWPAAEVKDVPAALDKVVGFLRAKVGQHPSRKSDAIDEMVQGELGAGILACEQIAHVVADS